MRNNPYEELRATVHFTNRFRVRATCSDCHVPQQWTRKVARKMETSQEVWGWGFGTINLLLLSLAGSLVNMPLFTVKRVTDGAGAGPRGPRPEWLRWLEPRSYPKRTVVTVNIGGAVIPVAFSGYLLSIHALPLWQVLLAIAAVAAVCRTFSRPIKGMGIGMPVFIAPIAPAVVAVSLGGDLSAPLAYVCGTLGVLVGADLLRINDIRRLDSPYASIGGAGGLVGKFCSWD